MTFKGRILRIRIKQTINMNIKPGTYRGKLPLWLLHSSKFETHPEIPIVNFTYSD